MQFAKVKDGECIFVTSCSGKTAIEKGLIYCPAGVRLHDKYVDGVWYSAQNGEKIETANIDYFKSQKQSKNKAALDKFLYENPLTWTDGNVYGVTEQDQTEMALNLMQYQLAIGASQPATLEWHTKGKKCHTFTLEDYTALSLAIANFVYPYRRKQEEIKEAIYAAKTYEELMAVKIDYSEV